MNQDKMTKLLILSEIAELPLERQQEVYKCAQILRDTIVKYEELGLFALALVGADIQLEVGNGELA